MKYLNRLREEQPEVYNKIILLAESINTLHRKEKRAVQRKILKIISNSRKNKPEQDV